MRSELLEFNWNDREINLNDFDHILYIVEKTIDDRISIVKKEAEEITVVDIDGKVLEGFEDAIDEISSDMFYYTEPQTYVMYDFGLWRLQGLFEGILKERYTFDVKLNGLKSKLDYVKSRGFTINEADYLEIIEWGKLRNALSHYPPREHEASLLSLHDLEEYVNLAKKVILDLQNQTDAK